jgi:hypothetical protein
MPFNPAPSNWLQGITVLSNEGLGNLPVAFVDFVAPNGDVFRLSVANDGTLITTGVVPVPTVLLTIDLEEFFPANGVLTEGMYGEETFGPWSVETEITGTFSGVPGSSPQLVLLSIIGNEYGGPDITFTLPPNTPLTLDVYNSANIEKGAFGTLTVTANPTV